MSMRTKNCEAQGFVGLFGYIDGTGGAGIGKISNLGMEGNNITGSIFLGGLVGWSQGGSVTVCYSTGTVSPFGAREAGGLIGRNDGGTVTACHATGAASGDPTDTIGGLIGWNDGTVTDSYATSEVTGNNFCGGLVGRNDGTITACYATGAVSGGDIASPGGLIGDGATVSSSFWDLETSGQVDGRGKALTTAQMKTVTNFQNAGWGALGWVMTGGEYPRLTWEGTGAPATPAPEPIPLSGSGIISDPYLVGTTQEFASLAYHIGYIDAHILLTADLDFQSESLDPIGDLEPFVGVFDGGGHVIRNVTIDQPGASYVGVFSNVGSGGEIRDLGVEGNAVTGYTIVGGLVGGLVGGTVTDCYASGKVSGGQYSGGLIGQDRGGFITGCYATGTRNGQPARSIERLRHRPRRRQQPLAIRRSCPRHLRPVR